MITSATAEAKATGRPDQSAIVVANFEKKLDVAFFMMMTYPSRLIGTQTLGTRFLATDLGLMVVGPESGGLSQKPEHNPDVLEIPLLTYDILDGSFL
jgi:hypothetical protein